MIKNIIFDVGGVLFDDKNNNLTQKFKLPKEQANDITKIAFTKNFKDCMLGKMKISEYINHIKQKYPQLKEELEYILEPKYYKETFPLKQDVYKIAIDLYNKGFDLYILSNNTAASYKYVSSIINLNYFKGVVCSYNEHLIKPSIEIYNLILDRYNLNKNETLFIDDSKKNIEIANNIGMKSILYKNNDDLIDDLKYYKINI